MRAPSPHSGLFSSSGLGPRVYHGPPNLRRVLTPQPTQTNSCARSPPRSSTSLAISQVSLREHDALDASNTPRSLKACLRVGVRPEDLVLPNISGTISEMRRAKENTEDETIVKMRHTFRVQMQQRKLKAALEAYWEVCEQDEEAPQDESESFAPQDSSRALSEERKLRKIVEANKSRLRQQLLRMQLHQKQRQREDEQLEAQRENDLKKRDHDVRAMAERSQKEEEAAALRRQARDIEKVRAAATADEVRKRHEAQDAELRQRMEQRRLALEESNAMKRNENRERRMRMKAQSEALAEARRSELELRMETFEREHRSRQRRREIERAKRRCEADARNAKIQEAIDKSNAQTQARVLATEARGATVDRRLNDFARRRFERRMLDLEDEMEKDARRQELQELALQREQERLGMLSQQMADQDERHKLLEEARAAQRRVTKELAAQRMLLKHDAVERQRRVEDLERTALLSRVESKERKIASMKERHHEQTIQRKHQREEAEKSRVTVLEVTPGPGDYVIKEGEIGTNSPHWRFGLPASASGPRVILKSHPVPGYDDSPGPGAYNSQRVNESRHRTRAAFSFTQAERFGYE